MGAIKEILFGLLGAVGITAIIIVIAALAVCGLFVIAIRVSEMGSYLWHRKQFLEWQEREKQKTLEYRNGKRGTGNETD